MLRTTVLPLASRQIVVGVISLAGSLLLPIALLPEEIGKISLIILILLWFCNIAELGLKNEVIQKGHANVEIEKLLGLQFVLFFISLSIFFLLHKLIKVSFGFQIPDEVWFVLPTIPFQLLRTMTIARFESSIDFSLAVRVEIIENIFYQASLIVMAFLIGGVRSLVVAIWARTLISTYICIRREVIIPTFNFRLKDLGGAIRFGLGFQVNTWTTLIRQSLYNYALGMFGGYSLIGIYDRTNQIINIPTTLMNAVVDRALFPVYSRAESREEKLLMLRKSICIMSYWDKVVGALLYFIVPIILGYMWGAKWSTSSQLLQLLVIPLVIFGSTTTTTNPIFYSNRDMGFLVRLNITGIVISAFFCLLLYKYLGLYTVIWVSYILWLFTIYQYAEVNKYFGTSIGFSNQVVSGFIFLVSVAIYELLPQLPILKLISGIFMTLALVAVAEYKTRLLRNNLVTLVKPIRETSRDL
jgi:O-antigen/teichoic acid export membrane protein